MSDSHVVRDGRLQTLSDAWVQDVLSWLSNPRIQPRVTLEVTFTGLNDTRDEPHRSYMVSQVADEILERASTKALIDYLLNLASVQEILRTEPPRRSPSSREVTFTTFLIPFPDIYLKRMGAATFQAGMFGELYSDLEELLFGLQSINVVGLVEFENVTLEYAPFELEEEVTIRRPTPADRGGGSLRRLEAQFGPQPEAVLEVRDMVTGDGATLSSPLSDSVRSKAGGLAEAALLALRLASAERCVFTRSTS